MTTRVLVACPSLRDVQLITRAVEQDASMSVIGHVRDLHQLVAEVTRLHPDVVLGAVLWPERSQGSAPHQNMSGLIPNLAVPVVIVVPSEGMSDSRSEVFSALRAGASSSVSWNPTSGVIEDGHLAAKLRKAASRMESVLSDSQLRNRFQNTERTFCNSLDAKPHRAVNPAPASGSAIVQPWDKARPAKVSVVGIAVSTGGASSLRRALPAIRTTFPVPIVIVIHLAMAFMAPLVRDLQQLCGLDVSVAQQGETLRARHVYFAPEGQHMQVSSALRVHLTGEPALWGCKPSADFLFRSLARNLSGRALGLVLTGMGQDGAEGLKEMRQAGCVTAAQDRESSIAYGMPQAATQLGAAGYEVPLEYVAAFLHQVAFGESS